MMCRRTPLLAAFALLIVIAAPLSAADDAAINDSPRSKAFPILASTYIVLNALDVYTTTTALGTGSAVEANPLVGSIASHPLAFAALKSASTATTIVFARRLWKRHPAAAVALLVGVNVGMGLVVVHNAQVAGRF